MKTLRAFTAVIAVASSGFLSCDGAVSSSSGELGETCAPDQMSWTFDSTGSGPNNAWSQATKPSVTPAARNVITEVQEILCRFGKRGPDGLIVSVENGVNDTTRATVNCRDLTLCSLPTTCVSDSERLLNPTRVASQIHTKLSWKCSDGKSYGDLNGGTDVVHMSCPQPPAAAPAQQPRTACVPRVCNGSMRRDENMNCVQDLTRPVIHEKSLRLLPLHLEPRFLPFNTELERGVVVHSKTRRPINDADLEHRLEKDQLYHLTGGLQYVGVAPPANARAALWLTEVHANGLDGGVNGVSRAPTESFRCLVKMLDVGIRGADGGALGPGLYTARFDTELVVPPDCFNEAIAYAQREPYWPVSNGVLPSKPIAQLKFHVSFDLEDTTHFVPTGKTQSEACSVDPLEVFYIKSTDRYDLRTYYRQRELSPTDYLIQSPRPNMDPVRRTSYEGYFDATWDSVFYPSERAEVGLSSLRVARPEVTIRVNSTATQSISVSADWYTALDSREYWAQLVAPLMHPKLRVYLVPRAANGRPVEPDAVDGYPTIGAIDLPGGTTAGRPTADPTGVTVNGRFIVDAALKQKLLSPTSMAYVSDGQRTFEVLGCFEAKGGDYYIRPEYWRTDRNFELGLAGVEAGNDADTTKAFTPPNFPSPGRGCRWSPVPLVVTIDKSIGAVEPIQDALWQGQSNTQGAGNTSVDQTNDNDLDRSCQPSDGGVARCEQGSGAGQRGKGDYGKSYYATSTSSVYAPGSLRMGPNGPEDDSESAGGAEVLGYQVLDPEADEDTEQWKTDPVHKTQKVTLTITPPWDKIWEAIQEANEGNNNPEWKVGRYAGLMGLGVGWGYKQPVGSFGLVTFTVSVGFSLALVTSVSHSFDPDGDYQCIVPEPTDGSEPKPCVQLGAEEQTFTEAVRDCGTRGARLAELSSIDEAAVLQTLASGPGGPGKPMWVGAQQLDEYNPSICAFAWVESVCKSKHKTGYRWLSNDETFASATGASAGTLDGSRVFISGGAKPDLMPRAPAKAGVLFSSDGSIASEPITAKHPYACLYDPATRDIAITISAAIELAFGAGVGIEWCYPTDELGICLAGTLNLVAMKVAPTVETTFHHLRDHRGRTARRDNTNLFAEWGVLLLEGVVELKFKALIFEFAVVLLEFGGFKIHDGRLYDFNFPSMEPFR